MTPVLVLQRFLEQGHLFFLAEFVWIRLVFRRGAWIRVRGGRFRRFTVGGRWLDHELECTMFEEPLLEMQFVFFSGGTANRIPTIRNARPESGRARGSDRHVKNQLATASRSGLRSRS